MWAEMGARVSKHHLRASGEVVGGNGETWRGGGTWLAGILGSTEGTHHKRQDGVPSLRRSACSSSSGTGGLVPTLAGTRAMV